MKRLTGLTFSQIWQMRKVLNLLSDPRKWKKNVWDGRTPAELVAEEICPKCLGELDTGWECNDCGYDARAIAQLVEINHHAHNCATRQGDRFCNCRKENP